MFCKDLMTIIADDELEEATETFTIQVQEVIPNSTDLDVLGMVTVHIQDNDDNTQERCLDYFSYFYYHYHHRYYYHKKY